MTSNSNKVFIAVFTVALVTLIVGSIKLLPEAGRQLAAVIQPGSNPITANQKPGNMTIFNNGDVRLSGMTAVSEDNGKLTGSLLFLGREMRVLVDTNENTLITISGATSTAEMVIPGATLLVEGTLQSFGSSLSVLAKEIRAFGGITSEIIEEE